MTQGNIKTEEDRVARIHALARQHGVQNHWEYFGALMQQGKASKSMQEAMKRFLADCRREGLYKKRTESMLLPRGYDRMPGRAVGGLKGHDPSTAAFG